MKKSAVCFILLSTALLVLTASVARAQDSSPVFENSINIKEAVSSEIFRYGRELYRKGDYREAANVFKKILAIDCNNTLAQYHLQEIAKKGPEFQDIDAYLKNLPCPMHDFSEEDFLPAGLYYEKDNDLLLEQLSSYNKRYRATKATLAAQEGRYADMIAQLEKKVSDITSDLNSTRENDAKSLAELQARYDETRTLSSAMDNEIARLKENLAAAKNEHQKELSALEDRINRNTASLTTTQTTASSMVATETTAEKDARAKAALVNDQAAREIEAKELELTAKSKELTSLQEKFANIQERLRLIERSLENKNSQMNSLRQDIQK